MAVANSDASSLLGGWSFRKDNLSRSLSHFVSLWDGDPTSIDRRNPESPEIFFYQRRLTALIMGQVNIIEDLLFSQAAGNGFTARCLPSMDRERPKPPADTSTTHQAALETPIPGNSKVDRRRVPADGVVHVRINASALEPWRGRAPWQLARVSASTLANIERSLESDVMVRSAILLPMPDASSPTALTQIKHALQRGMGAYNLIETTAQGFGQGQTAAPKRDWEQQRIGSVVPEHNTGLRTESAKAIMQAFGVSPSMFQGDGNAMREARRLMFLDSILPTPKGLAATSRA